MPISSNQCSPYLSVSLFKTSGQTSAEVNELVGAIRALILKNASEKNLARPRFSIAIDPTDSIEGTDLEWAHYSLKIPPSWFADDNILDIRNHIFVVAKRGDLYSFLFSDNGLRNSFVKEVKRATTGPMTKIRLLTPAEINKAFVQNKVRTLWLSGTHTRTTTKPDSKVLSGKELETALDPLGDQSYYFSSIRSTVSLSDQAMNRIVGASPNGSRIWIGPTQSWNDFTGTLNQVLRRATSFIGDPERPENPLPILASEITSLAGIEQPYDIALIVPERVNDGAAVQDEAGERWLEQFSDGARFEIIATADSSNFEADVYWDETRLGRLAYDFTQKSVSEIRLTVTEVEVADAEGANTEALDICKDHRNLTIYFDTGHTFSRGRFYETRFRDARFDDWQWVRMDLDQTVLTQEKPLVGNRFAVENVGNGDDWSLFGSVVRHWPNLGSHSAPTGWLVCDDGSMESADFIHIDDTAAPPKLTLIHVKGSGSRDLNRQISVSDYEVVVGQAIKNLRHIDRGLLRKKLASNANGVLRNAVWHNGVRQENRDDLLAMLDGLGSNLKKAVAIFQPRVRRADYQRVRRFMDAGTLNRADVRRMQQLDALLLGARSDCFSLGAEFYVISDGGNI